MVPFLTCGFPDPATTVRAAVALAEAGADVLELGIPFSDPMADGPLIQRASQAALDMGMTPARALELVAEVRRETRVPIVIMTYVNPVMQFRAPHGQDFAARAREAGADGILLTDLPPDQPHECWEQVEVAGLDPILLVTPTTSASRLATFAHRARGFLYCVTRLGITGTGPALDPRLDGLVESARAATRLPVLVGFGIGTAAEARQAARAADGVVVGSALLARMQGSTDPVDAACGLAVELIEALSAP